VKGVEAASNVKLREGGRVSISVAHIRTLLVKPSLSDNVSATTG
jgi:hypothetical protein